MRLKHPTSKKSITDQSVLGVLMVKEEQNAKPRTQVNKRS